MGASVWTWFDKHPDERENFAHSMMGITVLMAPVVAELFPFTESKIVCDIGGGMGLLLSELLVRYPHLRGMLADRAEVCADTYLLKNILHDWDDEQCRTILRNVRRAVPEGGRVLIVEMLLEHTESAGVGPMIDLQMMMACSEGRERSRADFARLLTDSGFAPGRVFAHPAMAVIEGLPS